MSLGQMESMFSSDPLTPQNDAFWLVGGGKQPHGEPSGPRGIRPGIRITRRSSVSAGTTGTHGFLLQQSDWSEEIMVVEVPAFPALSLGLVLNSAEPAASVPPYSQSFQSSHGSHCPWWRCAAAPQRLPHLLSPAKLASACPGRESARAQHVHARWLLFSLL